MTMITKMLSRAFHLGMVTIAGVAIVAASAADRGDLSFRGKPSWSMATAPSAVVSPFDPNPAGLLTIFSNLGTGEHVYSDGVGWDVAGGDSGVTEQWIAMPFTPTSRAEVTEISVALEHKAGLPDSFELSLNRDSNGLPGEPIHMWVLKNLPSFGTCCTLDIAEYAQGLTVEQGLQYWVVARTRPSETKTFCEWDIASAPTEGSFAINNNNGQGWYGYTAFTSAFGVFGKDIP